MSRARTFAIVACATCLGCGDAPADQLGRHATAIVDGEPSGAEDDGVLMIRAVPDAETEVICTASLVAPNLLLTARHCVSYFTDGLFNCSVRGELIEATPDAGKLGLHLPADSIEVYAGDTPRDEPIAWGVRIISTLSPVICVNDLAFVLLDTALELPLVPMRIGRSAEVEEAVTLVGYGMDGKQRTIPYLTQARRRKTGLEVAGVGPDLIEDGVTTVAPRSLIINGPSGCVGDSGGPLRAAETGALLAVYSLQEGASCTSPGVRHHLTHVPPFQALIEEAFAAAESEPLPEPGSETAPDAGAGGAAPQPEPAAGAGGVRGEVPPGPRAARDSSCAIGYRGGGNAGSSLLLLGIVALLRRRAR
jgi:hypothetical protein